MKKTANIEFWITNFSNRNVSLSDLNLTIKAFSSVNLLDHKHYSYNLEQLQKSAACGSIFKKKNKLVIRQSAPLIEKKHILVNREGTIPSRERSVMSVKEEYYEELNISDEEFAQQNADIAELDQTAILNKKG